MVRLKSASTTETKRKVERKKLLIPKVTVDKNTHRRGSNKQLGLVDGDATTVARKSKHYLSSDDCSTISSHESSSNSSSTDSPMRRSSKLKETRRRAAGKFKTPLYNDEIDSNEWDDLIQIKSIKYKSSSPTTKKAISKPVIPIPTQASKRQNRKRNSKTVVSTATTVATNRTSTTAKRVNSTVLTNAAKRSSIKPSPITYLWLQAVRDRYYPVLTANSGLPLYRNAKPHPSLVARQWIPVLPRTDGER